MSALPPDASAATRRLMEMNAELQAARLDATKVRSANAMIMSRMVKTVEANQTLATQNSRLRSAIKMLMTRIAGAPEVATVATAIAAGSTASSTSTAPPPHTAAAAVDQAARVVDGLARHRRRARAASGRLRRSLVSELPDASSRSRSPSLEPGPP